MNSSKRNKSTSKAQYTNQKSHIMNPLTNKETITSLEIAELAGKPHYDLMKSIRKMEESWVNLGQGNFSLSSYTNKQNKEQPMYELTKTECLYIASKFNDETRAKLVLRWEQLETEKNQPPAIDFTDPNVILQLAQNYANENKLRLEAEVREAKAVEVIELQEQELKKQAPKAEYYDRAMETTSTFPITIIAKEVGMTAVKLNRFLQEKGIQHKVGGTWVLKAKFQNQGLTLNSTHVYINGDGRESTRVMMKWTMRGRLFIHELCRDELDQGPLASKAYG